VLTPCAEALSERTRNIVHEARSILHPSTSEPNIATLRRTFTIRANDGFVEIFGAALISAVMSAAPFVRLRFAPKPEKSPLPLRDGSADLEIGVVSAMGPEVRVQALFRDRFIGVVRRGHPLAKLTEISAKHYAACGHVVTSRRGHSTGPVDDALAAIGLKRNIVAIVPSFTAALAIARSSDLVALMPASFLLAAQEHPKGRPVATTYVFELPVNTAPITISHMWHPRLELDAPHRWLREQVHTVCKTKLGLDVNYT
jgi:DNA-binding transcriptional LysR family regulator